MDNNEKLKKKMICSICNKSFYNIANHVRAHGISSKEYREKYGETSYVDIVANKLKRLFITKRSKWLSGYRYTDPETGKIITGYRTNIRDRAEEEKKIVFLDRSLHDGNVRNHLKHKYLVGVFFPEGFTPLICFDIDGPKGREPHQETKEVALRLINELTKYFFEKDIHVVFSGGKGYHVYVFFKGVAKTIDILGFAKKITEWNSGNPLVKIEFRPESINGKGVKLPLGKHNETENFCCFVDKKTLKPMKNSYEYLMTIEQIDPIDFSVFAISKSEDKNAKKGKTNQPQIIEDFNELNDFSTEYVNDIYINGLPSKGLRNKSTFLIAILLRDYYKTSENEAIEKLLEWTDREYRSGRTKDNAKKSKTDIESTVGNVFKNNNYRLYSTQELSPFEESLIPFCTISKRKSNARDLEKCKKIEECFREILSIGKYGNKRGFFFVSIPLLMKKLGRNKKTVSSYINEICNSFLLFKAIMGKDKNKFYEEMSLAIRPYLKYPKVYHWFFKQKKPRQGYNTLFFCPYITKSTDGKTFAKVITPTEDNFMKLSLYAASRFVIVDDDCEDILFKYNILFQKGKKFTIQELRSHVKEREVIQSLKPGNRQDEYEICKQFVKLAESNFLH